MATSLLIVSLLVLIVSFGTQAVAEEKRYILGKESPVNTWEPTYIYRAKVSTIPSPTKGNEAAVYRRTFLHDGQPEEDLTRVLVTGGYPDSIDSPWGSWIYTPTTNSWFHNTMDDELVDRFGYSLVTWCETNVLLFGGYRYQEETLLDDIWLFDGVLEEWRKVEANISHPEIVLHRGFHSAVTLKQPDSPCQCQDSMFVYGGLTRIDGTHSNSSAKTIVLDQLIELQCVEEKQKQRKYSWILHNSSNPNPPQVWLHFALGVNSSYMLVYGGSTNLGKLQDTVNGTDVDSWLYDIKMKVWRKVLIRGYDISHAPNRYSGTALFYEKYGIVLQVEGDSFHTFDLTNFIWQVVPPNGDSAFAMPKEIMQGIRAVIVDDDVLVFSGVVEYKDLSVTKVWHLSFVGSQWMWSERSPSEQNPPAKGKMNFLLSVQLRSYVLTPIVAETESTGNFRYGGNFYDWIAEQLLTKYAFVCDGDPLFNKRPFYSLWHRLIFRLLVDTNGDIIRKYANVGAVTTPLSIIWYLDLTTNAWWQYSNRIPSKCFKFTAITSWHESYLVTYSMTAIERFSSRHSASGRCSFLSFQSNVCVYDIHHRRWTETEKIVSWVTAPARVLPELTDIGNGSLAMFGGLACDFEALFKYITQQVLYDSSYYDEVINLGELFKTYRCILLNDLWILDMVKNDHSQYSRLDVSWRCIENENSSRSGSWPTGRIGHSLITVDSKLFVVGGTASVLFSPDWDNVCSTDLWYFDLMKLKWYQVPVRNSRIETTDILHPARFCRPRARAFGNKIVAVAQNRTDNVGHLCPYEFHQERVVSFSLSESKWALQNDVIPFAADNLYRWRDKVFASGLVPVYVQPEARRFISAMRPGCFAGQFATHWSNESCKDCPAGSFSQSGSSSCTPCPKGLTTLHAGAAEQFNCICSENYCGEHGKCFIISIDRHLGAQCECELGYTGGRCQYPTYFIIGGVSFFGLLVLLFVLLLVQRTVMYKALKAAKEDEVEQMSRAWNIKLTELSLIERLDQETRGSYGDIYKAQYRNFQVAVKKLKVTLRECREEKEFQREIILMRSIRHRNIVLFLGAGRSDNDDCPFLVIEYMERGALSGILHDRSINLTKSQQLRFCLDSAKGIQFLHSLRPPRIHRDIKSSNLLVSQDWVVKVADFGSARLVKTQGVRQAVAPPRNVFAYSHDRRLLKTPLLQAKDDMSRNPGAVFWRAPEVFCGEPYGTSADVYRQGVFSFVSSLQFV